VIQGHRARTVIRCISLATLVAVALVASSGYAASAVQAGGGGAGPGSNPGKTILARTRAAVRSLRTAHEAGLIYTSIKALPGSGQPGGFVKDVIKGDMFVARPLQYKFQVTETAKAEGNPSFTEIRTLLVKKGVSAERLGSTQWSCKRAGAIDVPWGASAYSQLILPGLATKVHDVRYLGSMSIKGIPAFHVRLTYKPKPFLAGVKGQITADLFISQLRYSLLRYVTAAKATVNGTASKYTVDFSFSRYGEGVSIKIPKNCAGQVPVY
jgi:hypothetical protein